MRRIGALAGFITAALAGGAILGWFAATWPDTTWLGALVAVAILPIGAVTGWRRGPRLIGDDVFEAAIGAGFHATGIMAGVVLVLMMLAWVVGSLERGAPPPFESIVVGSLIWLLWIAVAALVSLVVTIPCGFVWVAIGRGMVLRGRRSA